MRQLLIHVPRGHADAVVEAARDADAADVLRLDAETPGSGTPGSDDAEATDALFVYLSNRRVAPFLDALEDVPDLHVAFFPHGVLALRPPPGDAPKQVTDVELRAPLEVYLAGHQSIGSWRGFAGYAAAAGAIVWSGLYGGTVFLLTAAMLIAPFAGPAMNAALASAAGDRGMFGRSVLRYVVGIGITIGVTAALTWLVGLEGPTEMMRAQRPVSSAAVLLPLIAGAAGAATLIQSDRDSLVSGAAVGLLVAASLAPPAGVVGMSAALGEWAMAMDAVFVLLLQLVGINASASLVFRAAGLKDAGRRYATETPYLFGLALAVSAAAIGVLLFLQFDGTPDLQRSSLDDRIGTEITRALSDDDAVAPVRIESEFPQGTDAYVLLVSAVVRPRANAAAAHPDTLRRRVAARIAETVRAGHPNVTPLVDVIIVQLPEDGG